MIRNSFIFLSGIGQKTERQLWQRGIDTWGRFQQSDPAEVPSRIQRHHGMHCGHLDNAREALEREDSRFFAKWLPSGEAWRLFETAGDRVLYLDIESTGLSFDQGGRTTVVGGYTPADGTELLVKGFDLDAHSVQAMLDRASMVVTFNGKRFDIPFLQREFDVDASHLPHLDLMHALRKVGIRGGLKTVEKQVGITRPEDVQDMDGYEAVLLWKRWLRGDRSALETLKTYNREDVVNMEPLAKIAYEKLKAKLVEPHLPQASRA